MVRISTFVDTHFRISCTASRPFSSRRILDTNVLSAAAEEHRTVIQILSTAQVVALPVIVIGEYRCGIVQSRHKAKYRDG